MNFYLLSDLNLNPIVKFTQFLLLNFIITGNAHPTKAIYEKTNKNGLNWIPFCGSAKYYNEAHSATQIEKR